VSEQGHVECDVRVHAGRNGRVPSNIASMPETQVSFSILINNYNYGRFLAKAIDSAFAQTWPQVQIVVIDDGSTDNSREIAQSYSGDNYLVLAKDNGGQNSCIALGLRHATGDYTIVLDSDDWLAPDACETIARAIGRSAPNAVMYRLEKVDTQDRSVGAFPNFPFEARNQRDYIAKNGFVPCSPTSGNAYRTSFLRTAFAFVKEGTFSSDGYLAAAAGWTERVVCLQDRLGFYLVHGANASTAAGMDRRRRYANNNYALDHHRHLFSYLSAQGEWHDDWEGLISAYVWREILFFKLAERRYAEFSWGSCRALGVQKFLIAPYIGVWRKLKNVAFLTFGSLWGELRELVEQRHA
jgi:glycosyltransferase involved in cell wall biosynthesis